MKPYFQEDGISIYHGDAREFLPSLKADLLLTDPPYGIGEDSHRVASRTKLAKTRDYGKFDWDVLPSDWLFGLMRECCTWQIIFGGNYFPLPPSRCWLVWDKDNSGDYADCELAWTNLNKAVRRLVWRWNGMIREGNEPRYHPTQKPLNVIKWAMSHAPEEVVSVLDPYMGSGTTLVAAKAFGKTAVGIDKDERYCEIAAKRLAQGVLDLV